MNPVVAVPGTVNESVPGLTVPKLVTVPAPTVTAGCGDCSFNPAPVTVTTVPIGPEPGVKLKMLGNIRKLVLDCNEPGNGVSTSITPLDVLGTVA